MRVIGVDGVRGRWLAAVLDLDPAGEEPVRTSWLLGSAAEVLAPVRGTHAGSDEVPGTVSGDGSDAGPGAGPGDGSDGPGGTVWCGIDVPVGLAPTGPRAAEQQARALLGPGAGSSIFATAPQPAFAVARRLGGTRASRPEADAASRAAGGGGISTQAWGLADKVLEVEAAVRDLGPDGDRVVEVHPETSFAVMARHFRLPPPAGKRTAAGVARRLDLLARTLPGLDVVGALAQVPVGRGPGSVVPVDDALDALAAACSALRHAYGQARVLGGGEAVWSDGTPAPGRAVLVV